MNLTIIEAVRDGLNCALKSDKNVMIIGEDIGKNGGVFRATDGLQKKYGKNRVVDTPLAEAGIIGSAIGLAVAGMKPVAEIQFMGFLSPAFEQIISHAARVRTRSRGRFGCSIVIRTPYSGGVKAPEHHSESTEAFYMHTPGVKVVIPSSPYDAKGLLIASIRDPDPVVFLEPTRVYRAIREEVPSKAYEIPLGKANVVQEGNECTVIAWGAMMRECRKAVEESKRSVELIDLRTIYPIDYATIFESVEKTGKVLIVQEAPRTCSVSSELGATILENKFYSLDRPVKRITGWDTVMPLALSEHAYIPSVNKIIHEIEELCQ